MHDLEAELAQELAAWERAGLRRQLAGPGGVDFTSNDYLALARDPRVVEAARGALEKWGAGAPAARLLRGHLPPHAEAERCAAAWLRADAALLFPSGWHANQALLTTFAGRGDAILSDELNHASLIDGMRLSGARVQVFQHNDLAHLRHLLRAARGARRRLVVCESVYSMDGDLAPLQDLAQLAEEHDAWLIVDEAHAGGLYGPEGAGLCLEHDLGRRLLARVVTGGKALGVAGAFVAASRTMVELLLQRGRAFVFTTAPTPATAAALTAAIGIVRAEPQRRERAHAAAALLRATLCAGGVPGRGRSPIVPILIGSEARACAVAGRVQAAGFDLRAVRPPTVPQGTSRLRIVCHADHQDQQVLGLAQALLAALQAEPEPRGAAPPRVRHTAALVVAGTDTGVGKSVVAALLARAAAAAGRRPRYWKPIQTGLESDTDLVRHLAGLSGPQAPPPGLWLDLPASVDQAAEAEGVEVRAAELVRRARSQLDAQPEASWILECAGGLRVPLNEHEDQADFLARLGAPLVLVARSALGTLNHTLLTLEGAQARRLEVRAVFLVGPPHPGNAATLRRRLDCPLIELPWLEPLTPAGLQRWLARNPLDGLLP